MLKKLKIGDFGKVLVKFASAQVIYNILRLIAGFLVVRIIAPELYGLFSGVGIFLGYIMLGHVGTLNGLGRELPYQLGKGNIKSLKNYANTGYWISLIIGVLAFFLFSFLAIKNYYTQGHFDLTMVYATYSVLGFFHITNNVYLPVLYRTNSDFNKLSNINIVSAIVNIITVLLVYYYTFYGLLIRAVILIIIRFTLLYVYRPLKIRPKIDLNSLKVLLKVGLPIYIVGQIGPLWNTIQKNILFSVGGALQYGYYALVSIIEGAIGVIPNAFGQVVYPRMSIQSGKGLSKKEILSQVVKPTIFQFVLLLIIAIIGVFLLPLIIPIALPKYTNGIAAAQWAFFIPVVKSLGLANNYFNVVKKQKYYFIALICGAITGLSYLFVQLHFNDFNLVYFPQGVLIGVVLQTLLSLYFLIYKLVEN